MQPWAVLNLHPLDPPTSIFLLDYILIKKKFLFKLPTTYLESSEPYLQIWNWVLLPLKHITQEQTGNSKNHFLKRNSTMCIFTYN